MSQDSMQARAGATSRLFRAIALVALLPLAATAAAVTLKQGHPEHYTVRKGDTLWDIAGRFINEPWRWPEIWHANPQIKDPNLIYPGDELVLSFRGGKPMISAYRGYPGELVKLEPRVRSSPLGRAIPTIPVDAIAQFLTRPRVVTKEEMDDAPYIVSVGKEHLIAGSGSTIYVRGLGDHPAESYAIYRLGGAYHDPAHPHAVLGYQALHVGDAVLRAKGDPATLVLTRTLREVLTGDRLLAPVSNDTDTSFMPRPPARKVNGQVISVMNGLTQVGQHQLVVLDLGTDNGIATGNVLAVYQRGGTVSDPYARPPEPEVASASQSSKSGKPPTWAQFKPDVARFAQTIQNFLMPEQSYGRVRLPDVRTGVVMVVRPFQRVSYALVMNATRAIHVDDYVRNP